MVNVVHRLALVKSVGVMVVVANVELVQQREGLVSLACVHVRWRS